MKQHIKKIGTKLIYHSRAHKLLKFRTRILAYHKANPAYFLKQMTYLKDNFDVVSLHDALKDLDKKQIVITFDDGYRNNLEVAYPVLKELGLHATVFVTYDFADKNLWAWWDRIHFKGMIADFDHYKSINAYEVEKRIYEATGLRATDKKPEEYDFLSWQELKKMRGVFDIGSHTISHAVLTTLNEKDARKEIFNSRKKLEQKLGKIRSIAYPNGNANRMVMELAEEAGYECGLLYDKGVNDSSTDRMLLHRRGINYIDDLEIFASKVAGVF